MFSEHLLSSLTRALQSVKSKVTKESLLHSGDRFFTLKTQKRGTSINAHLMKL